MTITKERRVELRRWAAGNTHCDDCADLVLIIDALDAAELERMGYRAVLDACRPVVPPVYQASIDAVLEGRPPGPPDPPGPVPDRFA